MAKGYWIAQADIDDVEAYKAYQAANAEPLQRYGARFLVRGGEHAQVEGGGRSRHVVIEFPSHQAALDCYHSPEYQAALALREPVSRADVVIVAGYDGRQPGD